MIRATRQPNQATGFADAWIADGMARRRNYKDRREMVAALRTPRDALRTITSCGRLLSECIDRIEAHDTRLTLGPDRPERLRHARRERDADRYLRHHPGTRDRLEPVEPILQGPC